MKLPKSFRPDKNLDDVLEGLSKDREEYDSEKIKVMLNSFEEYLTLAYKIGSKPDLLYAEAEKLASEFSYDKLELEILNENLEPKHLKHEIHGLYISALINKIIEEDDTIIINLPVPLSGIGAYMSKGTLKVNANISAWAGLYMTGGKLVINGSIGDSAGLLMKDGEIIVTGNAADYTGHYIHGGRITIYGDTGESLGYEMRGGKIMVYGNSGDDTGIWMKDGEIHIKGNVGRCTGNRMSNGTITIEGNSGFLTGVNMGKEGIIKIFGNIGRIDPSCEGNIYNKIEKVWP